MKLYPEATDVVPEHLKSCSNLTVSKCLLEPEKYEEQAVKFWDLFYKRHGSRFFKDRHYLDREFPELVAGACTILEVGCGVGNTVYPLLEANPLSKIYAVDYSARAIEQLKNHGCYDPDRIHAHVLDVSKVPLSTGVPAGSVDFCTSIFVLSAISPGMMKQAVTNIASVLKPGVGKVFFRDYAVGDLAEERLRKEGRQKKLGPDFYVRGDGTTCHYFSEDYIRDIFGLCGLQCEDLSILERKIENRGSRLFMNRRWLQGTFHKGREEGSP